MARERSIGEINNVVIAIYRQEGVLEISGGPLCKIHDYLTTMLYT